jgi:hypothetical protein
MKPARDGHHQGKGGRRSDLEQGPTKGVFIFVHVDAAKGECQGDHQAAGNHEGQHVGHAGHQVLVGTAAGGRA